MPPVPARIISFAVAVIATWHFNRHFTFQQAASPISLGHEFVRYLTINLLGLSLNFFIYLAVVTLWTLANRYPLLALIPASGAAAVFNYRGSLKHVFHHQQTPIHK